MSSSDGIGFGSDITYSLGLIIPQSLFVSAHVIHVIRVSLGRLHQSNGLTVRGWEDRVQGLGKSYTNDFVAGSSQRRRST